jgi:hypothetical protein
MTGISEKEQNASNYDFALGVAGFHYSDLFDAPRLAELAENFYGELDEKEPILGDALRKYIAAHGNGYEKRVESKILTDAAPHLSEFVARLFHISRERDELQKEITKQNPIWAYKFFVQRRAVKKFSAEQAAALNETELTRAVSELKFEAFDETLIFDEELATATVAAKLLEAEEILTKNQEMTVSAQDTINKIRDTYDKLKDKTFGAVFARFAAELDGTGELLQIKAALQMLEAWSAIQFHGKRKKWHSLKSPHVCFAISKTLRAIVFCPGKLKLHIRCRRSEKTRNEQSRRLINTISRGPRRDSLTKVITVSLAFKTPHPPPARAR